MGALVVYVVVPMIAATAGLALLAWGLRGRRLDDHPICRRCGYDLVGTEEPAVCPECGARLRRRHRIRRGRRRSRPVAVTIGGTLLLVGLSGLGLLVWQRSQGLDADALKPVWLVRLEARWGSSGAKLELLRRIANALASQEQVDGIVADALDAQAQLHREWDPKWGELIEVAWAMGQLDDERLDRYIRQAVTIDLRPRTPVAVGDPVPVVVEGSVRGGRNLHVELSWLMLDDRQFWLGGSSGWIITLPAEEAPGLVTRSLPWRLHARSADPSMVSFAGPGAAGAATGVPVEATIRGEAGIEVQVVSLVEGRDPIELVRGERIRAEVARALEVKSCLATATMSGGSFTQGRIDVGAAAIDCAFRVFFRAGGREWPAGEVWSRRTVNPQGFDAMLEGFEGSTIDIVLRPSRDIAARTIDLFRICGEEIVLEDVPVEPW